MGSVKKKTVAVFFGGRSAEHEISIVSARAVLENLDPARFNALAVFIDRQGRWKKTDVAGFTSAGIVPPEDSCVLTPVFSSGEGVFYEIREGLIGASYKVEAAFPVIHGTDGEDGSIQGVFEMAGVPYVGARTLGSAVASDKLLAKQIMKNAGLPVVPFFGMEKNDWVSKGAGVPAYAVCKVGLPCFVKPSNLGSSIGISRVESTDALARAAEKSFEFSDTVVFESAVPDAREIEVSILGLDSPQASVPGEIIPAGDFYDYKAKYGEQGSKLLIPASLPSGLEQQIRAAALKAFSVLRCAAMARVDFLLDPATGRFFVSELNTIPGFTPISMYPRLWEASGVSFRDLISRLIDIAFESAERKKLLKTRFSEF